MTGVCTQPVVGAQVSVVHGLLSSHGTGVAAQAPPAQVPSPTWHMSFATQDSPSLFWQAPPAPQTRQVPHELTEQQTPSVQNKPAWHSPGVPEQLPPGGCWPHLLFTQVFGETQSALCVAGVQFALHIVAPLHWNGAQDCVPPPTLQAPAPLHVFWSVADVAPAGHDANTHGVPAGHFWHAPAPSQRPSLPHVLCAAIVHCPVGSALFAATDVHLPSVALILHDWQGPLQTVLQHTFSDEHTRPDAHWPFAEHGPPAGSSPHDPLMHVAFAAQSAFAVQVDLQMAAPH
jgi:hypothetical protein